MKQMFGYDPSVSWKIAAIRPSPAEGLTEVVVVLSNPQGQQNSRLYVTADGKHAVIGDIIPFGDHPFVPAQEALAKGMNGPSRGPADAPVTVVEFSDLQCPHCKEAQPTIDKLMSDEKTSAWYSRITRCPSHDWAAEAAVTSLMDALRPTHSGSMLPVSTTPKKTSPPATRMRN